MDDFEPWADGILIVATLVGPKRQQRVRMILDTGATHTLVRVSVLKALGYESALRQTTVEFTTAAGVEHGHIMEVRRLEALHHAGENFPVIAHELPSEAVFDGLLGLDFLRHKKLVIDFRKGTISLT